jgi:cytoskeletal protein RodZ
MEMIKTALQIKTIGSILKEKRKEQKLELKQVSDIIKIRVDYLQALEDGNYGNFPSEVYLKGFLKNYAKYLGIGTDKALALYRRENERKQNDPSIKAINKIKNKNFSMTFTPNRLIALIAGLAIILIIVYLSSYVGKVLKKPDMKLTSPVAIDTETEGSYKTDANFIEISGTTEIGSKLTINDQQLNLNNFEKFSKQLDLEEGQNKFVIKAESQFGRTKIITLIVNKEAGTIISPTPTPVEFSMSVNIEVQKKDTSITATVDGDKRTERLYKVGSTLDFTALKTFSLKTTTPASLVVKVNGVLQTVTATETTWEISGGNIVKK